MSGATASALASRARHCALAAAWAQWGALNPMLLPDQRAASPASVIDPEALVLASLALWDGERRLVDVLAWWARLGAPLMSLRRTSTLSRDFPAAAPARFHEFAAWARQGGDTRWKGSESATVPVRAGKGPSELVLRGSSTLLLRLRAGFGVTAKPDVLAFLLALDGRGATSKDIVRATGYADKNIRVAGQELATGGFLEERRGYPLAYAAPHGFAHGFVRLIERDAADVEVPEWGYWAAVYAFLLTAASWEDHPWAAERYVLSSHARDLFERHAWLFDRVGMRVPDPRRYRGEHYLDAFSGTLDVLCEWVSGHA
ncbi:MAG: hypothetical protein KY464_17150 [Gemmatimonadetes bacterium]|nr:hypothetical protein [Gemmatimonadota bacterium]